MTEMIKKWVENGVIIQIISAICTFFVILIYVCNYLVSSVTLDFVYNLDISLIKSNLWDVLIQFLYNLFISIPLAIVMLEILIQKNQKENKQKEKKITERLINLIIIFISTSVFVCSNHLVDFNNGKSLLLNLILLIINDFITYMILSGLVSFTKGLLKKDWEDNLKFIKKEIKTEKIKISIVLIIGIFFGFFAYLTSCSIINIFNETYMKTNYSILDDNITFIDNNKIETDVILYQTNDYLIVSDCVIDLKSNKITIYKSSAKILENRNINIRKRNFEKKEIKQTNSFDQKKRNK